MEVGDAANAIRQFDQLCSGGFTPTLEDLRTVLRACDLANNAQAAAKAATYFRQCMHLTDTSDFRKLVTLLVRHGLAAHTTHIFEDMKSQSRRQLDVGAYNMVIWACVAGRLPALALAYFRELREATVKQPALRPDANTYTSAITAQEELELDDAPASRHKTVDLLVQARHEKVLREDLGHSPQADRVDLRASRVLTDPPPGYGDQYIVAPAVARALLAYHMDQGHIREGTEVYVGTITAPDLTCQLDNRLIRQTLTLVPKAGDPGMLIVRRPTPDEYLASVIATLTPARAGEE